MENDEIIRLLRLKDERGLSYLYDHYAGALKGIIVRILNSEKFAEEALQQTFFKIWDKIDLYDENKSRLFTWISSIARNTAIDVKRLKEYEFNKSTNSLDLRIHNVQNITTCHAQIDVQSLTNKLKDAHKTVINHLYIDGYSQSETAVRLDIPLGTVKSRVKSAICELREILKNEKELFVGPFTTIIILIFFICL